MDKRETHRFLTRLFDLDDDFEVAYILPGGGARRVVRNLTEPDNLLDEMARAEDAGYNVYTSVLTTASQGAETYDRIWADMDDPNADYPFGVDAEHPLPEPTTLVKTSESDDGIRWQGIWLLDEAIPEDIGRTFIKRLASTIGADESVHDPRRVLRVPGIMNAKRQQMSRLISSSEDRYSLKAFGLPEATGGLVDKLLTAQVHNPNAIFGEWLDGVREGDRNRKAYIVSRFLKSCGVDLNDALSLVKLGAQRANPPLPDHEVSHAVKSAYHRS